MRFPVRHSFVYSVARGGFPSAQEVQIRLSQRQVHIVPETSRCRDTASDDLELNSTSSTVTIDQPSRLVFEDGCDF